MLLVTYRGLAVVQPRTGSMSALGLKQTLRHEALAPSLTAAKDPAADAQLGELRIPRGALGIQAGHTRET
jgi:hypothetical protein